MGIGYDRLSMDTVAVVDLDLVCDFHLDVEIKKPQRKEGRHSKSKISYSFFLPLYFNMMQMLVGIYLSPYIYIDLVGTGICAFYVLQISRHLVSQDGFCCKYNKIGQEGLHFI